GGEPGPQLCRGADRLGFVEHRCQFLDILLLYVATDMPHHSIHVQGKENLPAHWVLMPETGNVQFVASQKRLDNANELHRQVLLVATKAVGVLQVQLPCCTEDEILQPEILKRLFQVDC